MLWSNTAIDDIRWGCGFEFLPQSLRAHVVHVVLSLHTQAITGLSQCPQAPPSSPLHLQGSTESVHIPPGFTQDGCHWDLPDTFLPCPTLWFLLPPSPQLPSCAPQPAAYFEDLTGTSAVHLYLFHINPLCREKFYPSQVMNFNELCHSSAIQQMTSLPSVLAAAQLPFLSVNPTDEGYE